MWLQSGAQLGPIVRRHLCDGCRADVALINTEPRGAVRKVWISKGVTQDITRIQKVGTIERGDPVCHSGRNRKRVICGAFGGYSRAKVSGRLQLELGRMVGPHLRKRAFCTPGDSGGPVFLGETAIGIITAKSKKKRRVCFFTQLPYALKAVGLEPDFP